MAPAADRPAAQLGGKVSPETIGSVVGLHANQGRAGGERIVVAEAIALADRTVGMPQVVLQQIAVRVVIDQEPVDVGDVLRTQQIAHLFVGTGRPAPEGDPVTECQPRVRIGGEKCVQREVAEPLGAVLQRIDRVPSGHAVAADQFVPVDLREAWVVRTPRQFGLPVAGVARQVAVVVGHRRPGVVPVEHAVFRNARLGAERRREQGSRRQRNFISGDCQRDRLAPHARVADPAVLKSPRRVVEPVARQRKGLLGGGEARTPRRGRHDAEKGEFMSRTKAPGETQSGGQGVCEDPFDMHVTARAGIGGGRKAPSSAESPCSGDFGPDKVVAVSEAHRSEIRLQRLSLWKPEQPHPADRAPLPGRSSKPRITFLFGPQQAQERKVTIRQVHTRKRCAHGAIAQPTALPRHLRQIEIGMIAVEVRDALHGTVEDRGIGREHLALLLAFGIGIVFVVGMLRRSLQARQQKEQQATAAFQHTFATF